jgi:nucleoside-diphosphate-sugar epimerase
MRVPDISKARKLLGFDPKVGLEEGLGRCIEWYREHPDA